MNKAVFFDRDGVINRRIVGGYVRSWDEFEINPDFPRVLHEVRSRGYLAIIITNQRGVGRGLMTEDDLHHIHSKLQQHLLDEVNHEFDDILACTDAEDTSNRRKPSPAMLHEAADKHKIDLAQSWMVGDSLSDIDAGVAAGTHTAFLITKENAKRPSNAEIIISTLPELLDHI